MEGVRKEIGQSNEVLEQRCLNHSTKVEGNQHAVVLAKSASMY